MFDLLHRRGSCQEAADGVPSLVAKYQPAGDRSLAGRTAPAKGLCLMAVEYE